MKKTVLHLVLIAWACFAMSSSCDDDIAEEKAERAAAEMCECIKKKSVSKCEDELNDEYGYYANDDDFINAFNNAQDCGVTIYKK
ncbi:MAG: hypothetical protein LBV72_15310 [Tannerella sp.]|jgi:hypothetical protein|nr:hypothetical protein [Tannerella sp.]